MSLFTDRKEIIKGFGTIDVCIVTFNRLVYLQKCIWSIIATTTVPIRIFVIDDASTDGTQDWLLGMRDRKLIHALSLNETGMGTANCFNHIIKATQGEWFVMLNDDMYFYRWWDLICMKIIREYKDCGIVSFYDYSRFSSDQGVDEITPELYTVVRTGLGAIMINRELFKKAAGFYLSPNRRMGYFATSFCVRVLKCKFDRNKIYYPIPNYALHMDTPNTLMSERDYLKEYGDHRFKHKHQSKFRGK